MRRPSAARVSLRSIRRLIAGAIGLLLASCAHSTRAPGGHRGEPALGTVAFPVSCNAPAQAAFTRAVALLHHMTYPQAREGFERAVAIDSGCAMAHWGIAMTLFQPLWPTRPGVIERRRGWESVQRAKALAPRTERERLFIDAAAAFFVDPDSADYWSRIQRWEAAQERAFAALPDDDEAAAFYALAHLATTPPGSVTRTHADRAAQVLASVNARNPNHPGAMHYMIHANDMPGREQKSLDLLRRYEAIAPRNPHALHMPTHIYTRLGEWDEVIRGNHLAADAALEHPAGVRGDLVWDEFPHAIEYLVYAFLQKGMDDSAAAQLKRLQETSALEPTFKTAFHLSSTRARFALERGAWREAAALVPREPATLDWDRFAWPEAVVQFARGMGAARLGELDDAESARARIAQLERVMRDAREELFARNILMLRRELEASIAHTERRDSAAVALLQEAADLEAATPKHAVTPGPTLPANEMLGELLLEVGETRESLASFRQSLERYPGRFNSLLGAARAARASGELSEACGYYRTLRAVAAGGTRRAAQDEGAACVR